LYLVPNFFPGGATVTAFLSPGTYAVQLGGWTPTQAQSVVYRLYISIGQIADNPTPLTVGAAPALSIRLVNGGPSTPPVLVLPGGLNVVPAGMSHANDLPSLVNLLPSSPLARGAGGGVRGGAAVRAGGGLIIPALTATGLQGVLGLLVLTQPGGDDGDDDSPSVITPLLYGLESYAAPIQESLSRLIDLMYSVTDWMDVTIPSPSGAAPAADLDAVEMEDADRQEARKLEDAPFVALSNFDDPIWVGAVAALALYHCATDRRQRSSGVAHT